MKVTVEIDCTPVEARAFMGLPDVTPLNEKIVAEMADLWFHCMVALAHFGLAAV